VGILLTFVFVNNIVLYYLLGICPMLGLAENDSAAVGLGIAMTVAMTLSSLLTWGVRVAILSPLGVEFLATILFVAVVVGVGQVLHLVLRRIAPGLYGLFGAQLPLVSTNCAVLGIVLIAARSDYSALESLVAGFSAGLGFFLTLGIMREILRKLSREWIPRALEGTPITVISAALVALAFMAFDRALLSNLIH
jgi:electron transport complex protein RnfA